MLRIGIDAMGGDHAPRVVVEGALMALRHIDSGSRLVLFGDEGAIRKLLEEHDAHSDCVDIVHTTEIITMDDHPARAYNQKADSSIRVGYRYLKEGKIDGFAGAGATGAMLVGKRSAESSDRPYRPSFPRSTAATSCCWTWD